MTGARSTSDFDAIVVGSGPNGLTAAATIARAGKRVLVLEASDTIGGALRSAQLTGPGFIHDVGSSIHALAAASPAYRDLDIRAEGVEFTDFPILLAHVLDDGHGASLYRSFDETCEGLGRDGGPYRRLLEPSVDRFEDLADMILRPLVAWPTHPMTLARFGIRAMLPMKLTSRMFRTPEARALLAGSAAHSFSPLSTPLTTGFAMMLHASGHAHGWPVANGGSATIAAALGHIIERHGGIIETGCVVTSVAELPGHRALFLDTTPPAAAGILGDELPVRRQRRYRRFKHAPGVFKVDFALRDAVPWSYEPARRAGTVHVCGSYEDVVAAERSTSTGSMPARPFILVTQATIADPSRAPSGAHTAWTYAHVPNGHTQDVRPMIESQIERFAPGFRDLIIEATVHSPGDLEHWNRNLVGGDVAGGSYRGAQTLRRPVLSRHPYRTGAPRTYICSASTPPGGGAHGMSGYNAALDALTRELSTD